MVTGFALFAAPQRSFLLAAAAICLAGGAVLFWRQQRQAVCAPDALCARRAVRGLTLTGLLLGFVLLYLGYAYA